MIKARLDHDGGTVLFLGLSAENIMRLTEGKPIRIPAAQMTRIGFEAVDVILHYGLTEQVILADLKAHGVRLENTT